MTRLWCCVTPLYEGPLLGRPLHAASFAGRYLGFCSREMNEKRAQFFLQQAVAYNKKGDKRNAVFAMKRYKMHQGQVEKYNGMQENLLRQIDALQSVAMNKDYLEAIRGGAVAQKELQKDVNVEVRPLLRSSGFTCGCLAWLSYLYSSFTCGLAMAIPGTACPKSVPPRLWRCSALLA